MEALLDNDILSKLARYNLLRNFDDLLISRGHSLPYGRLGSAVFALRAIPSRLDLRRWPKPEEAAELCAFVEARTVGVDGSSTATLSALNIEHLDVGEIQLIARALDEPKSILYTGDKKAIQAIASVPALQTVRNALEGRVVCLEQVMHALSDQLEWNYVAELVASASVDTTLTRCYRAPTEAIMKVNVDDCIRQLRDRSGGLIAC